ncbi:MAG: tyrosine-type recombinase/integrase, partial [Chitinophagales bacterium]|nr:tyrosine-type recombinase/integrase [Chitinophagales bacterium]
MFFRREFSLLDQQGSRKYLNRFERQVFYHTCKDLPIEKRLFCLMLYYTGARISEITEMKVSQIDFTDKTVVIKTLKKRKDNVYRQMPLPDHLLGALLALIDHRHKQGIDLQGQLW